jgi:hypothetical protein
VSPIVTRKRKASIGWEETENEVKRTTSDYIKELDGKDILRLKERENVLF